MAGKFIEEAGIKGDDVRTLRELSIPAMLDIDTKLRNALAGPGEAIRLTAVAPVIDGEDIPDVPNRIIRDGSAKGIRVIAGTNLDEYRLFAAMQPPGAVIDEAEITRRLNHYVPDKDIHGKTDSPYEYQDGYQHFSQRVAITH